MKMSRAEYMQMRSKFELAISTALVHGKEEYRRGLLAGLAIFEETCALLPHSQQEWKEYTRQDIGRRLREQKQTEVPIKHQGKFIREEFRDKRLTANANTDYETFSTRTEQASPLTATGRYFAHKSPQIQTQKPLQSSPALSTHLQTATKAQTQVEIRITTGSHTDDVEGTREVLVLGTAPFMKHTYRLVQIPSARLDMQIQRYLDAKQLVYTEEEWHLRLSMGWFQKRYRPIQYIPTDRESPHR